MATHETMTPAATDRSDGRPVEMPERWIERALEQARRIGLPAVPEPLTPVPDALSDGEVIYREEAGLRVHPSWPVGYFEWLREVQESGGLEIGDPEELRRAFEDPQPE